MLLIYVSPTTSSVQTVSLSLFFEHTFQIMLAALFCFLAHNISYLPWVQYQVVLPSSYAMLHAHKSFDISAQIYTLIQFPYHEHLFYTFQAMELFFFGKTLELINCSFEFWCFDFFWGFGHFCFLFWLICCLIISPDLPMIFKY